MVEREPIFRPRELDMSQVGWSLATACGLAPEDDPEDGYCRLRAGHGGSHERLVDGKAVRWN